MKKKYRNFLVFAILSLSLFYFMPSTKDQPCALQESFEKLNFNGIVENKFVDRSQHSSPIIEIRNLEDNKIDSLSFFFDRSKTYDLINQSDTVYKHRNSLNMYIKRKNKPIIISRLDFGCNEV